MWWLESSSFSNCRGLTSARPTAAGEGSRANSSTHVVSSSCMGSAAAAPAPAPEADAADSACHPSDTDGGRGRQEAPSTRRASAAKRVEAQTSMSRTNRC